MKNLILFLIICTSNLVNGQDLWVQSVNIVPTTLNVGSPAVLSTEFAITDATAPTGCVGISIDLPPNITLADGVNSVSGPGSSYFDWFLSMNGDDLIGISNVDILDGGGEILVDVVGFSVGGSVMTFVTLFETGACGPFSDIEDTDNQLSSTNAVDPALPIELSSFSAKSNECGKVDLAWSTASEINNDYMEVQRSTDGKSYIAVGVVKGANNPRGADYTYTDDHALIDGVRYYYRLKQVDFDGRSETHKVVSVILKCPSSELGMKIYPNPAIYNTSLTITGANNPGVSQVKMTNASGEVVRTFSAETDIVTEIDLTGLPAGIYQLQSNDLAIPLVKRFIKID